MHAEKNSGCPSPVNKFRSGTLNLWNLIVLKLTLWDGIVFICNLQLIGCSITLIVLLILLSLLFLSLFLDQGKTLVAGGHYFYYYYNY